MNPKFYASALAAIISLVVVSAAVDKTLMKELKKSYRQTLNTLPEGEKADLDNFKQLLLLQSGDIYAVQDLFFDIPEVALSRAVIGFLQQKSGPYELSEEEKPRYTEDYHQKLVQPCEHLRSLWLHPISIFKGQTIADKGLVKSIKAEEDVYDWLETAYICATLVPDKDVVAEKSFKYMVTHKPRGRRGRQPQKEQAEVVEEQEHSVDEHPEDSLESNTQDNHVEGVPSEHEQVVDTEVEAEPVSEASNTVSNETSS